MADKKNALLITLAISLTITVTYGVAASGLIGSILEEKETQNVTQITAPITGVNNVLIDDKVLGEDNKNYSVLVESSKTNISDINGTINGYNILISPEQVTTPPPVPPTCPPGQHLENGVCVPDVVTPPPQPVGKTMKVIVLGDVDGTSSGTSVFNAIKSRNADLVAVLGDLGYDSDLKWFKSTYGTLGNKLLCVPGNHDAPEDGSSSIYTETKKLCGEAWFNKKFNKNLLIGVDTNGDLASQQSRILARLGSADYMKNITTVHVLSHKPCAVPPESHHPVEAAVKTFCDAVKAKATAVGVKIFFDQAHNHVMSASGPDGTYKQSGAGGRSHYTCPDTASTAFPFCNDSNYGFLEYTIKPDGVTTYQFIDYNGKVLYSK